jgi:tetratricopeptide (TPR) repeat protein
MLSQALVTWAEPYLPQNDAQVLERLTLNAADPVAREIRALRKTLSRDPQNLESAIQLAARYIELGRSEGDPRFLGQAQAVLAPWWNDPQPPTAVLLLRATIRQNAHEFDQALTDLDTLLAVQPANAQAWLTKTSILQVQGRYEEARRACQPLARLAARHVSLACLGDIASLTGQSAKGRELLEWGLSRPGLSDRERLWILTVLAEMSARRGDMPRAERYFSEARRTGIKDQYLLGAYADFLLDQGRARDVVALLQRETRADGLLLRLALAEQALHLPSAKDHVAMLAARFAAGRERGNRVHLREESRFTLALLHEPRKALALAQANWQVQKEPWDARLLLESALAAGSRDAAKSVIEWLRANRVEDHRLRQLAAQFPEGTL